MSIRLEDLKTSCDGNTVFTLWAEYWEPKDSAPYYNIHAISSEGQDYRTFEDATALERRGIFAFLMLFGVGLLLFLLFSFFVYLVGRNPEKYPKKVVYAFFREGDIKF